jgi:hypothetical protein
MLKLRARLAGIVLTILLVAAAKWASDVEDLFDA